MVYYFYFLLVGSRRNECNSLWGGIRGRGQKSTTYSENISVIKFYLSTLTLHLLWSIIFIFCVLAPEGMNAIRLLGREGGEVRSLLLTLSVMLNLFSSFTDDKMILQAITIQDKFIIILSQCIVFINACHTLHDAHLASRIPRHS